MGPIEISSLLEELPDELRSEVIDYIEYLKYRYSKRGRSCSSKPEFLWEDGLSEIGKRYSSVELQHMATEWR